MTRTATHFPHAMILCAGFGTRMRPLTDKVPKPLIKVAGTALADYAVEQASRAGAKHIVVNTHYLADQIKDWAHRKTNAKIIISDETGKILDTGGGVAKALPLLGEHPFLVFNADAFWLDTPGTSAIKELTKTFYQCDADIVLLLADRSRAHGYDGKGDFFRARDGRLTRRGNADQAPYVYAGCYAVHPKVFQNAPKGAFSMNLLWDRAIAEDRLNSAVIDGEWLHVGTPEAVDLAESEMRKFQETYQ